MPMPPDFQIKFCFRCCKSNVYPGTELTFVWSSFISVIHNRSFVKTSRNSGYSVRLLNPQTFIEPMEVFGMLLAESSSVIPAGSYLSLVTLSQTVFVF